MENTQPVDYPTEATRPHLNVLIGFTVLALVFELGCMVALGWAV